MELIGTWTRKLVTENPMLQRLAVMLFGSYHEEVGSIGFQYEGCIWSDAILTRLCIDRSRPRLHHPIRLNNSFNVKILRLARLLTNVSPALHDDLACT